MIHVFLLLVYLGVEDDRRQVSNTMYFESIIDCNYFAAEIAKRFGSYGSLDGIDPRDRVIAYCVPQQVAKGSVEIY
jgi:hypothetical protein